MTFAFAPIDLSTQVKETWRPLWECTSSVSDVTIPSKIVGAAPFHDTVPTATATPVTAVAIPATQYPAPAVATVVGVVPPVPSASSYPVAVAAATNYPTPIRGAVVGVVPVTHGGGQVRNKNTKKSVGADTLASLPSDILANVVKPGDKCFAKYKNKWYKAKILKMLNEGKKYMVSFADFKYTPVLKAAAIRLK